MILIYGDDSTRGQRGILLPALQRTRYDEVGSV